MIIQHSNHHSLFMNWYWQYGYSGLSDSSLCAKLLFGVKWRPTKVILPQKTAPHTSLSHYNTTYQITRNSRIVLSNLHCITTHILQNLEIASYVMVYHHGVYSKALLRPPLLIWFPIIPEGLLSNSVCVEQDIHTMREICQNKCLRHILANCTPSENNSQHWWLGISELFSEETII